jgi:hypothetical protein
MKKPLKFLDRREFSALADKEREIYLNAAAQELEKRQHKLRKHVKQIFKKPDLKDQ